VALGNLSANRKQKLEFEEFAKFPGQISKDFAEQMVKAKAQLTRLVGSTSFRGTTEMKANRLGLGKGVEQCAQQS
jgi:hypothetical protein